MQLATIKEDREVAREKYAEYLRAVKTRHNAEYESLKNAYRELSKGRQVIHLTTALAQGGLDEKNRPRLAAIRADARLCYYRWRQDGWGQNRKLTGHYCHTNDWRRRDTASVRSFSRVVMPHGAFGEPTEGQWQLAGRDAFRAVVPTIPPALTPSGNLSKYVVLWEAEWETIPVDPALLKPLGGGFCVVLATWDLTPLERMVLADREAKEQAAP